MILGDFFPSLILLTVCEGKINIGPLPGRFVTVALNFLNIALTVDMGILRRVAIFRSQSLTYEAQHNFPSFDLCVLFPMLMYE